MKKIKILLATAIIAAFTLTSCSKDDNNTPAVPATLEAKWTPTKTIVKTGTAAPTTENYDQNVVGCGKNYIQFVTGGIFNNVIYFKNATSAQCTQDASPPLAYIKTESTLNIDGDAIYSGNYIIKTLTTSDLVIETTDSVGGITTVYSFYFTKVN